MLLVSLSCHDIDDRWKQENNNIKNKSFYKENEKTERTAHFLQISLSSLCNLYCQSWSQWQCDRNFNL